MLRDIPTTGTFAVLSVRNQWAANHADIILLPRVLVSDCEAGLVSRAVAACCVMLLRPHFLFVKAAGYIWSGWVVVGLFHDSGSDDVAVSYLHLRKNMAA